MKKNYKIKIQKPEEVEINLSLYQGSAKSEELTICLHGFTHNAMFFDRLARDITEEREVDVVTFDMAGRGESGYFVKSRNYNYGTYSNILAQIIEKFGDYEKISLVGSSMGGLVMMFCLADESYLIDNLNKLFFVDIGTKISSEAIAEVGRNIVAEKIGDEFSESDLSDEELGYLEGIHPNYDPKLESAFWRKGKQINIPDMDFSAEFEVLNRKYRDVEKIFIRGEKSKFFTEENALELADNHKVIEIKNVGHLPLLLTKDQTQLITNNL